MILSILCISLGIVIGGAIVTFRKPPHDDGTSAAQQLDFLDAHKASVFYSSKLQWAVLSADRQVMGEGSNPREAIEAARRSADAAMGVQLEQAA